MAGGTARRRRGQGAGLSPRRMLPVLLAVAVIIPLVIVVSGALRRSPARPARPVVIASGSWAPFVGPDLTDDGPIARIITETLRSEGYEPTVSFSSWELAAERTQRREVFGSFPFIGSEARKERYYLSDPILEFDYVLFYSTQRWPTPPQVDSSEDIADLKVGRIAGYDVWSELDAAVDEFVGYETSLEAFQGLAAGEIDLLPEGLLPGRALIEGPDLQSGSADFGMLGGERADGGNGLTRSTETLHFMMPRTSEAKELMPKFNSALAAMKETDLFTTAVDEMLPEAQGSTVELVPGDASGVIELTDAADGSTLLAPQGTEALVLEWPTAFTDGGEVDPAAPPPRVRVKLLNGPSAGRVVNVDPRSVRLLPRSVQGEDGDD